MYIFQVKSSKPKTVSDIDLSTNSNVSDKSCKALNLNVTQ